ncbi:MAG: cyclic nucleotide-binding domain-containing protein [Mariprofundaceae bacterium]|nr:cyclic nucleotide-binding domain-containing protein [Mariprofundaceae bacterium]
MSDGDYGDFSGVPNAFQAAKDASAVGDYDKAYRLFAELWESDFWREDRDVQFHYAHACEKVGDHTTALKIYTLLMDALSIDPTGGGDLLMQESMTRLNDLIKDDAVQGSNLDLKQDRNEARLVCHLFEYAYERILEPGTLICSAGDIANHMWLLTDGEVDVIIPDTDKGQLSGDSSHPCLVGELAYFTGLRRAATLCCTSKVRVLELPFEKIVEVQEHDEEVQPMLDHLFRSRLALHVLNHHEIFKRMDDSARKKVAISFKHTSFLPRKILIEQGLERDNAFMVQSGTVLMMKKNDEGTFELIGSMHPGDIFHLGGLLRGFHAPYRVVTGTPCRLLRLKRETFEPLMQQHPWLIKELLAHSRQSIERQVSHPEQNNLWAADRYIDMGKK